MAVESEAIVLAIKRAQAHAAMSQLSKSAIVATLPKPAAPQARASRALPELPPITSGDSFDLAELPAINSVIYGNGNDEKKDQQRRRCMRLPSWVDLGLDPMSVPYLKQQMRLWHLISERAEPYDPEHSELTNATDEGFKRPGVYDTNDTLIVGDHTIAYGHLLMRSGIKAGDHVLEYGPGFGQLALAFARTGAIVDTVEVDPAFHAIVNNLASIYGVNLRCHRELFGYVPPDRSRFDLVMFYESFHHCLDFATVVPKIKSILSTKGKILMAGEPIVQDGSPIVPYPWGIRLDAENLCVVRERGWMELGFQESFIRNLFESHGFSWTKYDSISHHSIVYEAKPR